MALTNDDSAGTIYLSTFKGKMCQKVKEGTEGAVSRVNKNNVTVWEKQFSKVSGVITGVTLKTSEEYGNQYEIHIQDADEKYCLQISQSGRQASMFLTRIPNTDLKGYVIIKTWESEGKSLMIICDKDGKTVPPFYTKEEPNGLPPMKQITYKGDLVWDDTEQVLFYKKEVVDKYFSKASDQPAAGNNNDKGDDGSDLPF